MFNLPNGCIVYIFAFPSFNAIQLMILNWFIFHLEKNLKALYKLYIQMYTHGDMLLTEHPLNWMCFCLSHAHAHKPL